MSVRVKIPTQLRALTGGSSEVEVAAATVAELLETLDARHPGFGERVLDGEGAVRRFVNVYVANEDIRFADGLATRLPEGAEVSIIPAVAGG